jgi:hypothetical protein
MKKVFKSGNVVLRKPLVGVEYILAFRKKKDLASAWTSIDPKEIPHLSRVCAMFMKEEKKKKVIRKRCTHGYKSWRSCPRCLELV